MIEQPQVPGLERGQQVAPRGAVPDERSGDRYREWQIPAPFHERPGLRRQLAGRASGPRRDERERVALAQEVHLDRLRT